MKELGALSGKSLKDQMDHIGSRKPRDLVRNALECPHDTRIETLAQSEICIMSKHMVYINVTEEDNVIGHGRFISACLTIEKQIAWLWVMFAAVRMTPGPGWVTNRSVPIDEWTENEKEKTATCIDACMSVVGHGESTRDSGDYALMCLRNLSDRETEIVEQVMGGK